MILYRRKLGALEPTYGSVNESYPLTHRYMIVFRTPVVVGLHLCRGEMVKGQVVNPCINNSLSGSI